MDDFIKIGSLFAGIGGFELGLMRGIPNSKTMWQVEQNQYCQSILRKHWPHAQIYNDVSKVGAHNLSAVDLLCGGFPCQDISNAGKKEGIHAGKKSSLYWEMLRIICEIRPRVIVMENVTALVNRGLSSVLGSLAQIGYDAEWICLTASMFGACHRRERIFIVAYSSSSRGDHGRCRHEQIGSEQRNQSTLLYQRGKSSSKELERSSQAGITTDSNFLRSSRPDMALSSKCRQNERREAGMGNRETSRTQRRLNREDRRESLSPDWRSYVSKPCLRRGDDGLSNRVDRIKALGNAIVPQCSQWIGEQIYKSGLLREVNHG